MPLKLKPREEGSGIVAALVAIAVIAAIVAVGIYVRSLHKTSIGALTKTATGSSVIMIVKYSGGLCADGNVCSSEYKVYNDGTFQGHRELSASELTALKNTINDTDFLNYPKNPHPQCPSYSDGSDETLEFPQKYPGKSFTLCDLQIPKDDPAINSINGLIATHQQTQ